MPKKKSYEPLYVPALPNPNGGKSDEVVSHEIEEFLDYAEWYREENDKRFKKALKRMRWCAFIHGFLSPFEDVENVTERHFSWCPGKQWKTYLSRASIFQNTDEALEDFDNWAENQWGS